MIIFSPKISWYILGSLRQAVSHLRALVLLFVMVFKTNPRFFKMFITKLGMAYSTFSLLIVLFHSHYNDFSLLDSGMVGSLCKVASRQKDMG